MLVLSRHKNESVMIGNDIQIAIVDIRGDKVRLGIEAPQEIPVHRQEIYEAIKRENQRNFESKMDKLEARAVILHNRTRTPKIKSLTDLSEDLRAVIVHQAAKELGL